MPEESPTKQSLFAEEVIHNRQRCLVGDTVGLVDNYALQVLGDPRLADPLCIGIAVLGVGVSLAEPRPHGSAEGISAHDGDVAITFLKIERRSCERASRPD